MSQGGPEKTDEDLPSENGKFIKKQETSVVSFITDTLNFHLESAQFKKPKRAPTKVRSSAAAGRINRNTFVMTGKSFRTHLFLFLREKHLSEIWPRRRGGFS